MEMLKPKEIKRISLDRIGMNIDHRSICFGLDKFHVSGRDTIHKLKRNTR